MQPSGLTLIFELIGIEPSGNYKVFTHYGVFCTLENLGSSLKKLSCCKKKKVTIQRYD